MRSKKVWYVLSVYLIIILLVGINASIEQVRAEQGNEVSLGLTPKGVLFNLNNMKPGDRAERTITVRNEGRQDFSYAVTSEFTEGSEKLYKALQVEVKDGEKLLYTGSLKDVKKLENRSLVAGNVENLTYTILFPPSLGNEYQGLQAKGQFVFYAKGYDAGSGSTDGGGTSSGSTNSNSSGGLGILPGTSLGYFNYFIIGSLLIAGAVFVFRKKKRNI
ncbi:LPXTG cell wall anchor domain-containing protein [Microbacteriaceae bacterium 4G12]